MNRHLRRLFSRLFGTCLHCNHPKRLHGPFGGSGCTWHYHERERYVDDHGRTRIRHIQSHACPCPLSSEEMALQ